MTFVKTNVKIIANVIEGGEQMTNREMMAEVAAMYYEKKMTQQEIANTMYISRQTVSKLLNDAIVNGVVEITVHHPKKSCEGLEKQVQEVFELKKAVIAGSGNSNDKVRLMATIETAINYLVPILEAGDINFAICWGRTMQALISEFPNLHTEGITVYPLFGASDHENSFFASNEMARSMSDKIGGLFKYAWFPYLPDDENDLQLLKRTSYYKKMSELWNNIDVALLSIGNCEIPELFQQTFGYTEKYDTAVGDLITHFFTQEGEFLKSRKSKLRASVDNLKNAKKVIAVTCGGNKVDAIAGALRTGLIDVLITDEFTAKEILAKHI